jgi:UDP-N-acetylmuramyl pentapeptide phosphotransferase/UDP-N-acetylglucosamine-1-phosphate transferase
MLAWLCSFAGVYLMRRWAAVLGLVDIPERRSSHVTPTPRGGGLPIVVVVLAGAAALHAAGWIALPLVVRVLLAGAGLVAVISLADDRWRLPAQVRFVAHLVGAVFLVAEGGVIESLPVPGGHTLGLGWAAVPFTLLWIVGFTNAFNFMDGIDGLAAGQAIVTAVTMGWLGYLLGCEPLAALMLLVASATLGFLILNWPPAKVFMGDVGSAFLGFTLAGSATLGAGAGEAPPLLAWLAVLSPFILDTAITLIRRMARRERWFEAHREHYYQRLIRRTWSHGVVAALYLTMSALCAVVAILSTGYGIVPAETLMFLPPVLFVALVTFVRTVERREAV